MHGVAWSDLQDFLAVARAGQLARAAATLGVDPTTVGRRLRRLERHVGQTLFELTRTGQTLTEAGEKLLAQAEAMQAIADGIAEIPDERTALTGLVRMSASEGFGTAFIARHLPDFAKRHPSLTIDLAATSGFLSPSKRETDLAVLLARPQAGPVIASKLSDYALGLYASHAYVEANGAPSSANGPFGDFVGYVPDLLYAPELRYLDEFARPPLPRLRSSSINAQQRLIASGAGIGVLPCFMAVDDPDLVRVLPAFKLVRSFWIVTHKDTHQLRRIRALKEWLIDIVARHRSDILAD